VYIKELNALFWHGNLSNCWSLT